MHAPASATPVEKADIAATEQLARWRRHRFVRAAEPLSKLADQPPMLGLAAAGLVLGALARNPRAAEAGARMLATVLLATAAKTAVKRTVSRTRPHVVLDEGRYETSSEGSEDKGVQSFPSGHTADAVGAARAVVRMYPAAAPAAYGYAAAVAVLQPLRAKHFPGDVLVGAAMGMVAEALVDLAFRAAGQRVSTLISPFRSR